MDLERLLDAPVVGERPVTGGYTNAQREIVTLADGRTAFVKTAVDDQTRAWLAAEQRVYAAVSAPCMPRVLAADEGVLVLEDLSDGHWPPPWRDGDVQAVLAALDELHALTPPTASGSGPPSSRRLGSRNARARRRQRGAPGCAQRQPVPA
jgi:hypothetical protein